MSFSNREIERFLQFCRQWSFINIFPSVTYQLQWKAKKLRKALFEIRKLLWQSCLLSLTLEFEIHLQEYREPRLGETLKFVNNCKKMYKLYMDNKLSKKFPFYKKRTLHIRKTTFKLQNTGPLADIIAA